MMFVLVFVFVFLMSFVGLVKFRCNDGTFTGGCSINKPYFCKDDLAAWAEVCGCPENFSVDGANCVSEFYINSKNVALDYSGGSLDFVVYEGVVDYLNDLPDEIFYAGNETPSRRDFKLRNVEEKIQREAILPLVVEIQNLERSDKEQAEIVISLVQNIPYGQSNITENFYGQVVNHSRYPYEVLYDDEGICGERSELLALLLKELGYGVAIFYYGDENHEAVGIRCDSEESGYCYIETTTSFDVEGFPGAEVIPIADGRSY